jgi:hypothetical protein
MAKQELNLLSLALPDGRGGRRFSHALVPISRHFRIFDCAAALGTKKQMLINRVGMWTYPLAIREAATGIFLWPAWGWYHTIKGDKFKHIDFSHD